jgi:hypothetical protein
MPLRGVSSHAAARFCRARYLRLAPRAGGSAASSAHENEKCGKYQRGRFIEKMDKRDGDRIFFSQETIFAMDGNDGRYDEPQLRAAEDQYSPRHHNLDSRKEGAA